MTPHDPKVWTVPLPAALPAALVALLLLAALGLLGALLGWALAPPPSPPPAPAEPRVGNLLTDCTDAAVVVEAHAFTKDADLRVVGLVVGVRGPTLVGQVPVEVRGCAAGGGIVAELREPFRVHAWQAGSRGIAAQVAEAMCAAHPGRTPPPGAVLTLHNVGAASACAVPGRTIARASHKRRRRVKGGRAFLESRGPPLRAAPLDERVSTRAPRAATEWNRMTTTATDPASTTPTATASTVGNPPPDLAELVTLDAYLAHNPNPGLFHSKSMLRHFLRQHRAELQAEGAALYLAGRVWLHPQRFEALVFRRGLQAAYALTRKR